MQNRKLVALLLALLSISSMAADQVDTFGKLLSKQAQVLDSEMDAKIRANQAQGVAATAPQSLPGYNQQAGAGEPTVDAIWGLAGKEVAEMTYKGRRIPVSMQQPYISKIDGWKLESIKPYQVVLVKAAGKRVVKRKTIMFDWQGGDKSSAAAVLAQPGAGAPIMTPAITSPAFRP